MRILRDIKEIISFLSELDSPIGCLADTGFLYAIAYDDDRLFGIANDVFDALAENEIPIFANVISRMEFVDLIFRKLVTNGCIELFATMTKESFDTPIYRITKDIRDKDTAARKNNQSYKIDESRLKRLRENIEQVKGVDGWKGFCNKYAGSLLYNEWHLLEQEFGLNFVEILEGASSEYFEGSLTWPDMVRVMGEYGLRGPDAMIINLFSKSKFSLLITSDKDFESCFLNPLEELNRKAIFLLKS